MSRVMTARKRRRHRYPIVVVVFSPFDEVEKVAIIPSRAEWLRARPLLIAANPFRYYRIEVWSASAASHVVEWLRNEAAEYRARSIEDGAEVGAK